MTLSKWLTFGGIRSRIRIPDHFAISVYCGIGDSVRFISISHTVTGRFLRYSAKWLMPTREWIQYISGAIRQTSGYGLIQKSGFESRIRFWPWRILRYVSAVVLIMLPTDIQWLVALYCTWLCRCRWVLPVIIIIIIISKTMFMVLSSWQSHCESSPGSFDECRMAPSGHRPKTKT